MIFHWVYDISAWVYVALFVLHPSLHTLYLPNPTYTLSTFQAVVTTGEGDAVELVCLVSGNPAPELVWTLGGRPLLPHVPNPSSTTMKNTLIHLPVPSYQPQLVPLSRPQSPATEHHLTPLQLSPASPLPSQSSSSPPPPTTTATTPPHTHVLHVIFNTDTTPPQQHIGTRVITTSHNTDIHAISTSPHTGTLVTNTNNNNNNITTTTTKPPTPLHTLTHTQAHPSFIACHWDDSGDIRVCCREFTRASECSHQGYR